MNSLHINSNLSRIFLAKFLNLMKTDNDVALSDIGLTTATLYHREEIYTISQKRDIQRGNRHLDNHNFCVTRSTVSTISLTSE
jgi:hypothetical protein